MRMEAAITEPSGTPRWKAGIVECSTGRIVKKGRRVGPPVHTPLSAKQNGIVTATLAGRLTPRTSGETSSLGNAQQTTTNTSSPHEGRPRDDEAPPGNGRNWRGDDG